MSIEVTRQNIAAQNVISPVGTEVMAQVRGQRGTEGTTASSEVSKLQDAAEELGMSVAHRADRRSLAVREVRQGQATDIEALARIADYYDKLPDMPREAELQALVGRLESFQDLLAGGGRPSKEDILQALQEFDGDVTHQFQALEVARQYFETTGADAAFLTLLDEARADFERPGIARDVRAGFAAAEIAHRTAATLETDPATVRETYRAMLRDQQNMGQLFDAFAKFDMLKNFDQVVETFLEAAGRDLSTIGDAQLDRDFLHALLTELGKLKQMRSTFEQSKDLIRTTDRMLPDGERGRLKPVEVTSGMLNFVSKATVNINDARALIGTLRDAAASSQLKLANSLNTMHGEIPDAVMPSMSARQLQSATIRQLLGELVAAEEREFLDTQRTGGKAVAS